MGLISNIVDFMRTRTIDPTPPSYETPASRPADGSMSGTNQDTSVQNTRSYVSVGPARTKPDASGTAGTTPSPSASDRFQASIDRRSGSYPKPGSDSTTNVSGDSPMQVKSLPYGFVPSDEKDR